MSIVVTGARGFIGRAAMARWPSARPLSLSGDDWRERIAASDFRDAAVLHLGARAHGPEQDDAAFADAAVKARALGEAAASGGARILIFASSIKVNGDSSGAGTFGPADSPHPEDAYGRSKLAAEDALREIAQRTGLPVHIVRPPLVYGRHARGNLARLVRLCDSPWPLPFASVANRRSFLALDDLVELLARCMQDSRTGTHVWLAAHPEPVSTHELVTQIRAALGRARREFPLPPALLAAGASMLGRGDVARRLLQSLVIDARATYDAFAWHPRIGIEQAVREMVESARSIEGRA